MWRAWSHRVAPGRNPQPLGEEDHMESVFLLLSFFVFFGPGQQNEAMLLTGSLTC